MEELKNALDNLGKKQAEAAKIIAEQIKHLTPEQQKIVKKFQSVGMKLAAKGNTAGIAQEMIKALNKLE